MSADLDKDEEELVYGITKTAGELVNFYQSILEPHRDEMSEEKVQELEKEIKYLKRLFKSVQKIAEGEKRVKTRDIKKHIEGEEEVKGLSKDLAEYFAGSDLEMAGKKGLRLVEGLEELSKGLYDLEEVKRNPGRGQTESADSNTVETQNATYYIQYQMRHDLVMRASEELASDMDAYVLELARMEYEDVSIEDIYDFRYMKDSSNPFIYREIVDANLSANRSPIFLVDLPIAGESYSDKKLQALASQLIEKAPLASIAPAAISASGGTGVDAGLLAISAIPAMPAIIAQTASVLSEKGLMLGKLRLPALYSPLVLRTAVAARKMEESIAPSMTGNPNIYVTYGGAHAELGELLENKGLRDFIISLHSKAGFPTVQDSHLDKIAEFSFDPSGDKTFYSERLEQEFGYRKAIKNI